MSQKMILSMIVVISLLLSGLPSCGPSLLETKENYLKAHPNLEPNVKDAILNNEVLNGMTPEEVIASWGEPDIITKNLEGERCYEYRGYRHKHDTVIFGKDDKVRNVIHRR